MQRATRSKLIVEVEDMVGIRVERERKSKLPSSEFAAKTTASVDRAHLVEIFDAGIDDATGKPFIAMEPLRAEELGDLLSQRE